MARGRTVAIVAGASVLAVAAAGGGAYYLLHTRGTPQETARRFAAAWERGQTAAMAAELAAPQSLLAYDQQRKALGVQSVKIVLGAAAEGDGRASVPYTATYTLADVGAWTYRGSIDLKVHERHWKVDWKPATLHPAMTSAAQAFSLKTRWPQRAPITDTTGARIDTADPGSSLGQLVGFLDKATAKDVARLGSSYRAGDPVGRAGLQATFQRRLAGTPTTEIRLGEKVLATIEGRRGEPLRTTIDPRVHAAAVQAIRVVGKPASLVALKPSTGGVLAVVNNRGDMNRALDGQYAPGSTFKAVTALGLLQAGMRPGDRVGCPKYVTVGGLKIRNSEHAEYGSLTLSDAFAHSCNTTFAPLARDRLGAERLRQAAELVGFNQPLAIGVPARQPSFPPAASDAELAAASFGQARLIATPLSMAAVAAAVAEGTWRPPTLVEGRPQKAQPRRLPQEAVQALRPMMAAVVTKGTAKDAGLPAGTRGKTGTAEYGNPVQGSHAWFMGFRGDLAFAVIVEGGGGGGKVAAPVAADFLRALDA
ncbi:penicillin-binding transpeptidase domain-containing protein [Thermoactinospora rubra]|uniref:penicillin-binding transpeptidase domain-containing protein n=1 Tax=Thermoactinospora rubra TaxID=1088767 RepID=UPI000A0F4CD5|nr:penicillin-binding transpeptidase domain-containing protein [Thermoactinospora rubra]